MRSNPCGRPLRPGRPRAGASSVRYRTSTEQAVPERHIARLHALMLRARIYVVYGVIECKRVAYLPPELIVSKPASGGIPIPDPEAWIEDESGAVICTPGV